MLPFLWGPTVDKGESVRAEGDGMGWPSVVEGGYPGLGGSGVAAGISQTSWRWMNPAWH